MKGCAVNVSSGFSSLLFSLILLRAAPRKEMEVVFEHQKEGN
jgi:hypothetical protein